MKRSLIILLLAALVALPLIITGCSCGGGASLTESDIATIQGFGGRLDAVEGKTANLTAENVTKLNDLLADLDTDALNTLADLDTDALNTLADLDADELAALLLLDLDAALADVAQLKTDMSTLKGTTIPELDTRMEALENGGTGGAGGSSTSGQVTVILDTEANPLQFSSGTTPINQMLPIKITNGTSKYQKIIFGITLRCVSSADYKADVAGGFTLVVNGVPLPSTPVPALLNCQYIYFLWTAADSVLVAPGKEAVVYATLNNFATAINYELWEVTLSGVTVTPL